MKPNIKDAIQCAGFATTLFALFRIGAFTGWAKWIVFTAIFVFLIAAIIEIIYPKWLQ